MDNEVLSTYKQDAHIIELSGDRLLHCEPYTELRTEYEQVVLASTDNS